MEVTYAEPPAEPAMMDIPPPTPDFEAQQGYLDPAPLGIDAEHAWTIPGGRGQNVKIMDVEGAWNIDHEDMPLLSPQGGSQYLSLFWRNHGTAVLGEMVGIDNGYGVTGIVPQAQAGFEGIANQSPASAIANAAAAAGTGGIVLIELHQQGPANGSPCDPNCSPTLCNYIPMEYWPAEFDAIEQATANGTIVVEAGGNGSADLDDPVYGGLFDRNVRDSGALLVAASLSTGRWPTCWTNYGSRIDVHGWGENVVTLGYGDQLRARRR